MLTQTAKRLERHWELASWETTAIYLPTQAARREYDACHDAVQQADTAWDVACQGLQVAGQPLEELLHAARDGASQPSSADDALRAVMGMGMGMEKQMWLWRLFPLMHLDERFNEAKRCRFEAARP